MYLNFLFYTAAFFSIITVTYVMYALKWSVLKRFWQLSKFKSENMQEKKAFIKKQELAGKTPFKFEGGNVIIYAYTQQRAIMDYKTLKNESKMIRKKLKKA